MAEDKYERVVRLFPRTFKPIDGDEVITNLPLEETTGKTIAELWNANIGNPVINAILRGFAGADQTISEQLQETKASLFVKTAENRQLDVLASSLGVSRPSSLGLPDAAFQNLIPPLSLQAKQVRSAFYNAMDAFWGPEFSRANIETVNTNISTFDLQLGDTLTFKVDSREAQSIVIRNTSGIANFGAATTLELNNLIIDNLIGVTSEILIDPITKIETVRVLTTTPGLRGSIQFSITRSSGLAPSIFPTTISELLKQPQRTVIYEVSPNEVVIEIPAFIPTLARGLKGSLHVHNGPLVNNIIDRGETTNYILPTSLFNFNALNEYGIINDPAWVAAEAIYTESSRNLALTPNVDRDPGVYEFIVQNLRSSTFTITDVSAQPTGTLTLSGFSFPDSTSINSPVVTLPTVVLVGDETDDLNSYASKLYDAISSTEIEIVVDGGTISLPLSKFPGIEILQKDNTVTLNGVLTALDTPIGLSRSLDDTFKFFVRVENPLARSVDTEIWRGAFIFDPNGTESTFTVTGQSAEITGDAVTGQDVLAAGQVHPRVTVDPATNTLPTDSELAIIGFGTSTQEAALIRYRGRASDGIIELDPSFVFTNTQPSGTFINIISSASPFVPDRVGNAYPIYLTSSSDARVTIQEILQTLAAAGVVVNFVVIAPDYKYLIDNPYLDDDEAPRSGSEGQQVGYRYIIDDPTTSGDSAPSN